jgi:hypothetical protein
MNGYIVIWKYIMWKYSLRNKILIDVLKCMIYVTFIIILKECLYSKRFYANFEVELFLKERWCSLNLLV